jgi:hypothetical protein
MAIAQVLKEIYGHTVLNVGTGREEVAHTGSDSGKRLITRWSAFFSAQCLRLQTKKPPSGDEGLGRGMRCGEAHQILRTLTPLSAM